MASPPLPPQVEKELFDVLDLPEPCAGLVRDARSKGQDAAALHALAEYLRHRAAPAVKPLIRNPITDLPAQTKIADDAVRGYVKGGFVPLWHQFPDGKIDWLYDAPKNTPGESLNEEWQWQLCRMMFWDSYCRAYLATHDERYARAYVEQFRSFAAQCPPPPGYENRPGSAWRTLETGLRMGHSWSNSYETFIGSPEFTDADIALFLYSCLQHARYLKQFPSSANWLTMEMQGLYTVGVLFPEFKEARGWRDFAATTAYQQEKEQFLPDGAQFELSTSYDNVALDSIMEIPTLAKRVGRLDELPAGFVAGMEKAYDFDLFLTSPERVLPRFNDSSPINIANQLNRALAFFPQRQDYRWIVSDGKEGTPPTETSHAFDWAGYYAMRSGWERDANYLVFRAGPIGYGHCQQDKLAVQIWAFGRQVLFGAGGGQYEHSPWRLYASNTFSHNCVLVDGKPQRQQTSDRKANVSKAPIDARWESTPDYDFAAGVYDKGYGEESNRLATQTRRVLFVKPDLFVVADTLVPNDTAAHTYQARWHLLSTQTQLDNATKAVATTDPGQSNLAVVPLRTDGLEVRSASAQTEPEILGWRIEADPKRVPATTVLQTLKGVGQQNFVTLFLPSRAGNPVRVQGVRTTDPRSYLVSLSDGRSFSISVDPNPAGGMEFSEQTADGSSGRRVRAGALP